ncbi:NMDA receptor-regulated protein 1-domain-containing protein [Mycotypha africana]|uniref:NMDA receptor-regulated protein 1-domain-containing protein n=1 Tax=Mycotypha africana TaxID=64632 RepID=UPI002301C8C8|nr:NMDA receptor-regulated protein 1-domain-containing protein [Mycotypha africana]KAI8988124.1 NMDA receptor-regulated protein 1-domain-containing protein [Mycotypha africana]
MAVANKQELPLKEAQVFRNILKNYELRQYKKGLKLAEGILKKYPDHGETLAMKGLFLNNLEKKEEGYEYVKKGLLKNLTSHICWHVYGLLYRADKNYEEAAKCYANALKFNKNDINILRDYAVLQTQLRQYDALVETRTKLLESKPSNPPFWLGLAIAYQLAKKPLEGVKVLRAYTDSEVISAAANDFERSELHMYENMLLEEGGDYQAAMDHLISIESKVTDKRSWKEKHALYLLKLDRKEEAEKAYRDLISENPHHSGYVTALLSMETEEGEANKVLADLFTQYPRSKAIEHLILQHAEGDSFRVKVAASLQNGLRKGIPSLFASMKKYYAQPDKKKAIEELVAGYYESLQKDGTFGNGDNVKEPPTALLWTLYYLAKQSDFRQESEKALEWIEKAIAHTPTVVELYMTKGRILKHMGQLEEAWKVMNEARELDLQDRFINSKCAKYMLRAGHIEEAERILGLFTRKDVTALQDLTDMQCQWFMVEEGYAYLRKKEYGKALKRFHALNKFYEIYFDDQFDFHSYCLRKLTLRAYVEGLRWEDSVKKHPFYLKAAKGAVAAYLALADSKADHTNEKENQDGMDEANMSEAEKKKARNKARKAALKAQQEKEAKKKEETAKNSSSAKDKKNVDTDPDGEAYLHTEKPLEDALQFVQPLTLLAPDNLDVGTLAFDIYLCQQKYLLALKSLVKISQINKESQDFKLRLGQFEEALKKQPSLDSRMKQAIDVQLVELKRQ